MKSSSQRAFLAGEVSPALYARTDAQRYAFGLRTCRNAVVLPGGGVSKRPGTAFVLRLLGGPLVLSITPTILAVGVAFTALLTAVAHDGGGNVVSGLTVTWESDDPTIASVVSASSLTATVHGNTSGTTAIRARIADLGLVSNDSAVTVDDVYILHEFVAGTGDFQVISGSANVRMLLVAGGASGGSVDGTGVGGGGGGGGGVLQAGDGQPLPAIPMAVGHHPITIGGGGPQQFADHTIGIGAVPGANGADSTFAGFTAKGGGGGGGADATLLRQGRAGGSGGGGASAGDVSPPAGAYNGGTGVSGQGNNGENGSNSSMLPGARGGGAGGPHGVGIADDITGAVQLYGAGGDGILGPGVSPGIDGTGNGGEGGGQALFAAGTKGGAGTGKIRYKRSTLMVVTGGTISTYPV